QLDLVLARHVPEHPAEPVVRAGRDQIGLDAEFRAAERGGHRVAAEGNCIFRRNPLLVAYRNVSGHDRHVDIGMSDEQGMHQQHSSRLKWRCDAYSGAFRTKINPRSMPVGRRPYWSRSAYYRKVLQPAAEWEPPMPMLCSKNSSNRSAARCSVSCPQSDGMEPSNCGRVIGSWRANLCHARMG